MSVWNGDSEERKRIRAGRGSIPGQEHLPPALLRLSVGIEAVEDLWADLDRALRNVPEM